MFVRSHILGAAVAFVLAGSVWAQTQPPVGESGQTPPTAGSPSMGSPTGAPRSGTAANPGAVPQDQQQMDPYIADKDFIRSVAESSATQVHLGKLAQDKASNDAVKELGKRLVQENTQNTQELKQAATALNVQLPSDPPRKAKKAEEKLAKLSGGDFDRAYAKIAADEQKQTVKQFEREAKNGKSPGLKEFASKNLTAQQECQKQAEELASGSTGAADRTKK
jgi:putative membrane protein